MKMETTIIADANKFINFLLNCPNESKSPVEYEGAIQIHKVKTGVDIPLLNICSDNQPAFICEKYIPKFPIEVENEDSLTNETADLMQEDPGPLGVSVMKARQLLSWYAVCQNPSMSKGARTAALSPLWVRCDMADSEGTAWLGAETIHTGDKSAAIKLHTVNCKAPTVAKVPSITLEELKQMHKRRHHSSSVLTRGSALYNLFGSTVVENTVIESQSSVTADFRWNNVESLLQTPPLSSTATLNIKVANGDMRSPMYSLFKELEFIQILAEGLRTGETEWLEPLETRSAVELTKELIQDLQNKMMVEPHQSVKESEAQKGATESSSLAESSMYNTMLTERGDLDFTEQLWLRMRKSVTSHQDIVDCLKMVIKALKYGDIKPWVHRDSSSSLSKLILQSYHQQMEPVSLTGLTPVHMLLEIGLDKMKKDYINYLIGQELTTLNHLSYYLSTEADLQEQVVRAKKLHHLLEIVVTCSTFLSLAYEQLFLLTQSCLQYYRTCSYDEDHEFQLQIRPAVISSFYQKEHPITWSVEISSGQGKREVRTSWQLSDKPPVDHVTFDMADFPLETTLNGESEEPAYFTTSVSCSLVNFS
ncbi:protein zwilch homolog isoform X1 [Anguilla rostrata]|uniref:protein zwilch homolog isoform X1 n=1 Tax=Anguilla rostrata TaxID=7938 RepID=UPI0030D40A25